MSNIIIIEKKKQKKLYNKYADMIEKNGAVKLCSSEINNEFLEETLEYSDYLIVHMHRNNIRGFACVDYNTSPERHLYISLICNVKHHSMTTRKTKKDVKYSGKHIIERVIEMAKKKRVKYVKLSAINNVITYYYHLGFTFDSPDLQNDSKEVLLTQLKGAQKNKDEREMERILNKIVGKYFKGFYNEKRQREIGEDDEKDRKVVARDDGIPMIYYLKPSSKSMCVGKTTKKCAGMPKCKMTRGKKRRFCRTRKNKILR
jgi:hypothetical protein